MSTERTVSGGGEVVEQHSSFLYQYTCIHRDTRITFLRTIEEGFGTGRLQGKYVTLCATAPVQSCFDSSSVQKKTNKKTKTKKGLQGREESGFSQKKKWYGNQARKFFGSITEIPQELREALDDLFHLPPSSQDIGETRSAFPSENWVAEPWASSSLPQENAERPTEDIDRPSPPHIMNQKVISEGTLTPSATDILIDVPTVEEHLPVATLSHGLERVLFKYVIYLSLDFLTVDKCAAPVSIGYETRVRGCITSLHG